MRRAAPCESRKHRGYVLLFVLFLLLVVTVLAAAVMQSSSYEGSTMLSSRLQAEAALNAMTGAQAGVARLRADSSGVSGLPLCDTAAACPVPSPVITLSDPHRYAVTIFRRNRVKSGGPLSFNGGEMGALVVVSSLGSASFDGIASNPSYSALVEVEVQVPDPAGPGSGAGGGNEKAGGS